MRIAWGLGSGRHLRAAAASGERLLVLAIDVRPGDLLVAQEVISRCPTLAGAQTEGRLELVVDRPEVLRDRFARAEPSGPMLVNLAALAGAPAPAQPLARLVERIHLECRDAHRHRGRFARNLRSNAEAIASAASLAALSDAGLGRGAIVLAAGPSAADAMTWLPEARASAILIAVDTALPLCRSAGIDVDVLASVDPLPASAVHLSEGADGVGLLAFQPYCAPQIVSAFASRVVACPRGDAVADRLAQQLQLAQVGVAGTVLVYAMQVAAVLGCDPIVLVGADLAHVGGRTHAEGTATSRDAEPIGLWATTYGGARVATTHTLQRFRVEVERVIAASPASYWAVDGGGAAIAGARPVCGAEVTELAAAGVCRPRLGVPRTPSGCVPGRTAQVIDTLRHAS